MNLEREGGCLCGAVRFKARLTGTNFGVCHCPTCRKWTGSALLGITVPEANVEWSGVEHIARRKSSDRAERAWCAECGSPLWFRLTDADPGAAALELPVGSFDDANGLTMTNENFIDAKPDSYGFGGKGRIALTGAEFLARSPAAPRHIIRAERYLTAHPLYLDYVPGRSSTLVLAFTGVGGDHELVPTPEAFRVTSRDGENHVLFIGDASRSWMNADGMVETLQTAIADLVERIRPARIVAFGNSMGGSAALIYASLFKVDAVLAIVPQFSVKDDLVPNERRWRNWRQGITTWRFPAVPDLSGRGMDVMILHGDEPREMMHARLFAAGPGVDHYVLPQQGHSLARGLKLSGHLFPLVGHVLSGQMDDARQVLASAGGRTLAEHLQAVPDQQRTGLPTGEEANADPA